MGVFGAALFYGDSVITPAISVLSAVEGLEVVTPAFKPYVLPISIGVLIGLFAVQRFGTGVVGKLFGPVIAVWFVVLAVTGVVEIVQQPAILAALNPLHAVCLPARRRAGTCSWRWAPSCWRSPAPKRCTPTWATSASARSRSPGPAWCCPSLALNYMGQGALLMRDPTALENPFFRLFPAALADSRRWCWPPSPPSSRRRRSSPAPTR